MLRNDEENEYTSSDAGEEEEMDEAETVGVPAEDEYTSSDDEAEEEKEGEAATWTTSPNNTRSVVVKSPSMPSSRRVVPISSHMESYAVSSSSADGKDMEREEASLAKADTSQASFLADLPPPETLAMSCQQLTHTVKLKTPFWKKKRGRQSSNDAAATTKRILGPVDVFLPPGKLTAIMGASGAGKTTLLDALTNRYSEGTSEGTVLVGGRPRRSWKLKQQLAFVKQEDLFIPSQTVFEALWTHARLRLPNDLSDARRLEIVRGVLKVLDLTDAMDTMVGDEFVKGISGGELKRLAIAAELLTNFSICALDEPTTGLDASTALSVMEAMLSLARTGRTLVCTIHQPRLEVFQLIDHLVLLSRGRVVYQGPAMDAVAYFANLGLECPPTENPADFLLDILSEGAGQLQLGDLKPHVRMSQEKDTEAAHNDDDDNGHDAIDALIDNYQRSSQRAKVLADIEADARSHGGGDDNDEDDGEVNAHEQEESGANDSSTTGQRVRHWLGWGRHKAPWWVQFWVLLKREWRNTYRNPLILASLTFEYLFFGLFVGFSYYQLNLSPAGVQDRIAVVFWVLMTAIFVPTFAVVVYFPKTRAVFNREYASGMYSSSAFYLAATVATIPSQLVLMLVFCGVVYLTVGLREGVATFFEFYGLGVISAEMSFALGLTVSAAAPTFESGNVWATVVTFVFLLTAGFFVSYDSLPDFLKWITVINPYKYMYDAYMTNQFGGVAFTGKAFDPVVVKCNVTQAIANVAVNVTATSVVDGSTFVTQTTLGDIVPSMTCIDNVFFSNGTQLLKEFDLDSFSVAENVAWLTIVIGIVRIVGYLIVRYVKIGKS